MLKDLLKRPVVWIMLLLGVLFVLGIWQAFPLTSVIYDEMYFAGGVLRAMQAHSLLPQGLDVPYGTLTYFASYGVMSAICALLLPIVGWSVSGLTHFFVSHVFVSYVAARIVSLIAFVLLMLATERFWRRFLPRDSDRAGLLLLVFTTLLPLSLVHTGKVWIVSTVLLLLSFMCLVESKSADKYALWSIIFACLSFANFPIMGLGLVVVPVLLWRARSSRAEFKRLLWFSLAGLLLFGVTLILNFHGIEAQVVSIFQGYTFSDSARVTNLSIPSSIFLNILKTLRFAPLLFVLIAGLLWKERIRDKRLFGLSVFYLCIYLLGISLVARWSTGLHTLTRYLLPVPFFLGHMAASFSWPRSRLWLVLPSVSLILGLFFMSALLRPTTFNQARVWIDGHLNQEGLVIHNLASPELTLSKNPSSYSYIADEFCASICLATRSGDLTTTFLPLVVDEQSTGTPPLPQYVIVPSRRLGQGHEIARFETGAPDGSEYLSEGVADYFDPALWAQRRFGRNLYIYKVQ